MERFVIPAIVGFAPVLTMLLSWAPSGQMEPWAQGVRGLALPVLGSELFLIVIAARAGMLAFWRTQLARPQILIPLALLLAIVVYTTLFVSPDRATAMIRSIIWIIHLLFGVSIAYLCGRHFAREDLVSSYLAGFMVFAALLGIFALQVDDPQFDWTVGLPAATHIRHLGYYAAAIIGLCIGRYAAADKLSPRIAAFIVCSSAFGLAFWTGARGTIAAAVGAYAVGLLLFPPLRKTRVWTGFIAAGALGAAAVYALPPPAPNMGFARTVEATTNPAQDVMTGRTTMWRGVVDAIAKRPLAGWGDGQMPLAAPFWTMVQPHNVLLQVLLAWGALGTFCLLLLAGPFAWRSILSVRATGTELLAPFMGMAVTAIYALFDGTLFHIQSVSIFAACAGMIAANSHSRPGQREPVNSSGSEFIPAESGVSNVVSDV